MNRVYYNPDDPWVTRVAQNCSVVWEPYKPPWWCFSSWINVLYTIVRHYVEAWAWPLPLRRDCITTKDGGLVSIDWADDTQTRALPADSPVIAILHTLTGDSDHYMGFMRYAARHGWRSCVLNRRGHSGMVLKTPNFCLMGNIDDTVAMVTHIRQQYPDNFLGLAGLSAGSGQAVSFAGREGDNSQIDAVVSLCPAWDLEDAFCMLLRTFPTLDRWLVRGLQYYFVNKPENEAVFRGMEEEVEKVRRAASIDEFTRAAYPFAGCQTFEEFVAKNNPMNYLTGLRTPTLVLNALDDFVSLKENIRCDIVESGQVEKVVLVITEKGGHVAYNEGLNCSYMWRIALNFFEIVRGEANLRKSEDGTTS